MKKILSVFIVLLSVLSASAAGFPAQKDLHLDYSFQSSAEKSLQQRMPSKAEADPVNLTIMDQTYNSARFTWFYYGYAGTGFTCALWSESQEFIAGVALTHEAYQYMAYLDGVSFADDEVEFYCSTYWVLNCPEGLQTGSAWEKSVTTITNGENSMFALKPGTYYVQIRELDDYGYTSASPATLKFTLTEYKISDLKAEVSGDNKTATITWTSTELPQNSYLYISVLSGETVAFDNFGGDAVASPLVVNVEEGRSYNVVAQVLDMQGVKLGSEESLSFTVGTNNYTPQNPTATVSNGDEVHFAWEAASVAEYYSINIYKDGEKYATLNSKETSKDADIETGDYTWEVAAFELGSDGFYYPVSEYVAGNAFSTKSAELPDDAIELDIAYLEAAYITLPTDDEDYRDGLHPWLIMFGSNTLSTCPSAWITVYSTREAAISGKYSTSKDNVAMGNTFMYLTSLGGYPSTFATNVELTLNFDGYYQPYVSQGYHYGTYSGSFRMTCDDGKTYYGKFSNQLCRSYHYEHLTDPDNDYIGMLDEDTSDSVERVLIEAGFDINKPMYNLMGQQVTSEYKGIVIQNGKKYLLR